MGDYIRYGNCLIRYILQTYILWATMIVMHVVIDMYAKCIISMKVFDSMHDANIFFMIGMHEKYHLF